MQFNAPPVLHHPSPTTYYAKPTSHLLAIWSCSWGQTMASAPPRPAAQSVDKKDMSRTNYNGGITTTLATKLCTYLFQLPLQQTPRLRYQISVGAPLHCCTKSSPPLRPRARRSWYEEQELRQSGSLYAWYTYRVVIEQGEANCLLLMIRGPPYLAQHPLSEYGPRRRALLTQRRKCAGG